MDREPGSVSLMQTFDSFRQIVEQRRSVRIYDQNAEFDPQVVQRCLELATLSPNSSNMQLWEFYRITDPTIRAQMVPLCMGQNSVRTASELVVAATRPERWRKHAEINLDNLRRDNADNPKVLKKIESYYGTLMPLTYWQDPLGITGVLRKWIFALIGLFRPVYREASLADMRAVMHKSTALACMTFMYAMRAEGYDTCPLEGFDSARIKRLLNLPRSAGITMVIACGKGDVNKGIWGERHRLPYEEVIKVI